MQIFYSTLLRVFNQHALPFAAPSKKFQQHYEEILSLKYAKGHSESKTGVNSGSKYQKNTQAQAGNTEHWGEEEDIKKLQINKQKIQIY